MRNYAIFILLFIFLHNCFSGLSQIQEKGLPLTISKNADEIPLIVLPSIDIYTLQTEDVEHEQSGLKSMRYAEIIDVDIDPENAGRWEILQNGDKIWTIRIKSTNAYSLGVYFDYYRLPIGSKLFIYNSDKSHTIGAFTYKNNKTDYVLATAPVKGDEVIIEYFEPNVVDFNGEIHISSIAHDYKNIFDHISKNSKGFGSSGTCNVDINCTEGDDWQIHKHSVCKITMNGWLCTGALINNTNFDEKPYFLTANHCIDMAYEATAAIFYFNYESPTCNGINGPTNQTISGSTIKATSLNNSLDFTLLELSSKPPESFYPYYAGWNRNILDPSSVTTIHHPLGDVKKISKSFKGATTSDYEQDYNAFTHWWIDSWDIGTTEGGSSGSPLFDQNKRIIGDLTGGDASCSYNFNDYYQQFHHAWQNNENEIYQLKHWLDPIQSGLIEIDGFLPYDTVPSNLKTSVTDTLIKLYWNKTINPTEIKRYYIYKNNIKFDSTVLTSYTDTKSYKGSVNTYWITAKYYDIIKNESLKSNTVTVRSMDALAVPYIQLFDSSFIPLNFYEERTNDTVGWTFKSGGFSSYIDTAFEGINNAYFFTTNNDKAKLIFPKLNLELTSKAILSFYLNLYSANNNHHKLKVLFRENDSLNWRVLRSFENPLPVWQKVFVSIPGNYKNAQIAFEGSGEGGYGICIDSIRIVEDTKFITVDFNSDRDSVCTYDTVEYSTSLSNTYNLFWDFGETAIPQTANGKGPHKIVYTTPGLKPATLIANNSYIKYVPDYIKVFGFSNPPDFINNWNTLISNTPYGNRWFLNGTHIPGEVNRTYTITQDGEYSVEVTNFAGCTETSEVKHLVLNSVNQFQYPLSTFQIFPNPNNGHFTLQFDEVFNENANSILRIVNIIGNTVHEEKINTNEPIKMIRVDYLPKGVYFIQLIDNKRTTSIKLLIG